MQRRDKVKVLIVPKRRHQKPLDEIVWYAMRVDSWNFHCHFGIAAHNDPHPYREFRTIEIAGTPIRPVGLNADRTVLDVSADALDKPSEPRRLSACLTYEPPLCAATLRFRRTCCRCCFSCWSSMSFATR